MQRQRIDAVKYNYSLDQEVQNFTSYDCQIFVSENGENLIIINKKPIEKDLYVLEADPNALKKIKIIAKIIELEELKFRLNEKDTGQVSSKI